MGFQIGISAVVFGIMLFTGVPIAYATLGWGAFWLLTSGQSFLIDEIPYQMFAGADSFTLLAIPLFMLAGEIMNTGGLSTRIFDLANLMCSRIRGGLAYTNIVGSTLFGGISGSSQADVAALGAIEVKAMVEAGYDEDFSAALTAATALQAPLIPPSMPAVTIGGVVGVSIGALFMGGLVPGLLLGAACALVVWWQGRWRKYPHNIAPIDWREARRVLWRGAPALGAPVIILVGMLGGVFSPTEVAAVACVYAALVAVLSGETKLCDMPKVMMNGAYQAGRVYITLGGTAVFGWVMAFERWPMLLGEWVVRTTGGSKPLFWLMSNLLLILWGCFLPILAAQLLLCPILFPIALKLGIHPVHFGILVILNLMMGMITPPVGGVLFSTLVISNVTFNDLVKQLVPYLVLDVILLIIVTSVPEISLAIPRLFGLV